MRTCRVDVCIQVPVSLCQLIFAVSFSAFCPSCEDILSGFGKVSPRLHIGSTDNLKAQQEGCGFGSNQDLHVWSLHVNVLAL